MSICEKWNDKKNVNPITGKKITSTGDIYKNFSKFCDNKIDNCKKLQDEPNINPVTSKRLKDNSKILELYNSICSDKVKDTKRRNKRVEEMRGAMEEKVERVDESNCMNYPDVTLKEHQKRVTEYIMNHMRQKGILLFHSVGSGKTITSITIVRCLLTKDPLKKVFVITPKSLVDNYEKEIKKLGVNFGNNVVVTTHSRFINKVDKEGVDFVKNSIIVVDEAHNFKGDIRYKKDRITNEVIGMRSGYKAKVLMDATKVASKVILLTATPIQNRPTEFTNLYGMITNNEDNLATIEQLIKSGNDDSMKQSFKNKISYYKNTNNFGYPTVEKHLKIFYMNRQYYKIYSEIEENEQEKIEQRGLSIFNNNSDLTKFLNGVRRATNSVDADMPTPKIQWIKDFLINNNNKYKPHKVLIYSNWIKSGIRLIESELDEENIPWVEIYGDMSIKKRKEAVEKYNGTLEGHYQDNTVNIMFISAAGAEGLDLKNTRDVIILENHWNNERINQVIGRAVRYQSHLFLPEDEQKVDIYTLILKKPRSVSVTDPVPSADDILYDMSEEKDKSIQDFYEILEESSI